MKLRSLILFVTFLTSSVAYSGFIHPPVPTAKGGTGQSTYTDGQLLIGNSSNSSLSKAAITAGSGITVTNGNGSITVAASGGGTTVYWALITGGSNAYDPCTSSPCTILRQGPTTWLSSVTRTSAGLYVLNYSGSPFANIPAAVISCEGVNSGEIGQIRYGLSSSSELTVQTVDPTTLSRGDGSFSVLVPAN